MLRNLLLTVVMLLAIAIGIRADQGNTAAKMANCPRINEKIVIDGILSESVWQRTGFSEFTQQEPTQGEPPSCKSEVWFAYDEDNVYFAGKFYDPYPDSVLARLVRRDFVFGDPSDGTVLYLDPYHDHRNGFYFYVSAAGTMADGTVENDNKVTDGTWDAVWEGVPHFDKDGWSVEMRIPLSQLRFKDTKDQVWGFNVERYFSRNAETDMIAYTPRNENGFSSRFPDLKGITGVRPSNGLEFLPYVTGKAELLSDNPDDPFDGKDYSPGIGLDIKSPLGNSLTLNATINPDFGQVEVDPAYVDLSDVEHTFNEKRPFFTDGVNIFRFGNGGTNSTYNYNWQGPNIFYSRRIGRAPQAPVTGADYAKVPSAAHIIGAAKITGEILNDWKIGTVHALTSRENADRSFSGVKSKQEVEPLTYYGVFRARKDFNAGFQGLGLLATYTNRFYDDARLNNYINKNATVAAVDGWSFLDENRTYVLSGWAAGSIVSGNENDMIRLQRSPQHYFQRPDASYLGVDSHATSLAGYAGRFMINKNRGQWILNSSIGFLSPKFEVNDLGYGAYSDLINYQITTGYKWNTPAAFYQNIGFTTAFYRNFDFGGNKTTQGYALNGYVNLPDLSGFGVNLNIQDQSYSARRTRGGPLTLNPNANNFSAYYYTNNRLWWVLNPNVYYRSGDDDVVKEYSISVELKLTPTLTLTLTPDYTMETNYAYLYSVYGDRTAASTYGRRYVFSHVEQSTFATDIRLDWILTPQLSIQAYIQPFYASAKFSNLKVLNRAKSLDFTTYGQNGSTIREGLDTLYGAFIGVDADGAGPSPEAKLFKSQTLQNFNQVSLRGNVVLRWEYRPGSAFFFVWTQNRYNEESEGQFELGRLTRNLLDAHPDNIFMVKFTYWLGI